MYDGERQAARVKLPEVTKFGGPSGQYWLFHSYKSVLTANHAAWAIYDSHEIGCMPKIVPQISFGYSRK